MTTVDEFFEMLVLYTHCHKRADMPPIEKCWASRCEYLVRQPFFKEKRFPTVRDDWSWIHGVLVRGQRIEAIFDKLNPRWRDVRG